MVRLIGGALDVVFVVQHLVTREKRHRFFRLLLGSCGSLFCHCLQLLICELLWTTPLLGQEICLLTGGLLFSPVPGEMLLLLR